MNPNREAWNQRQQALRLALARGGHAEAIALFLEQHAAVHSARVAPSAAWSFADEALQGLSEAQVRAIPAGGEHSIAWLVWHMARIEDATMAVLAGGSPQLFESADWAARLNAPVRETGNALDPNGIAGLSAALDLAELAAYRDAVGNQTRAILPALSAAELRQKVRPERLALLAVQGAVPEAAAGLLAYWGGLTVAGLLLMPPTRHNFLHLNEALRIRARLR